MSKINLESGTPQTLPISVGAFSEIGLREENQDNMTAFASPLGNIYLIADGMGGYKGGAEAARLVTEGLRRYVVEAPNGRSYRDILMDAASHTNSELMAHSAADSRFAGMGSTAVLALIRETDNGLELITAHVGDSRVYVQRGGSLTQMTKDHTRVQWLIDSHALTEEQARQHPDASVLTQAFGHTANLSLDVSEPIPLLDGDGVLLCSDGLSGFVSGAEINQVIQQYPEPNECAQHLVKLALARDSNDNITVQFIRIGNAPKSVAPAAIPKRRETLPEGAALAEELASPAVQKKRLGVVVAALAAALACGSGLYVFRDRIIPLHVKQQDAKKDTKQKPSPSATLYREAKDIWKEAQDLQSKLQGTAKKPDGLEKLKTDLDNAMNELNASRIQDCEVEKRCDEAIRQAAKAKAHLADVLKSTKELDQTARAETKHDKKPTATQANAKAAANK